jgi:hypothetical protein
LEIPDGRNSQTMKEAGFDMMSVIRVNSRDGKMPIRTVMVVFSDAVNQDTLIHTGMQVESMHISTEPARQTIQLMQYHLFFKFNPVTKY